MIDWMLGCIAGVFVFVFWNQIFDCFKAACMFVSFFIAVACVFVAAFIVYVFDAFTKDQSK